MKSSAIPILFIISYTLFPYSLALPCRFRFDTRRSPPDTLLLTEVIADTVTCGTYTIVGCGHHAHTACLQIQELSFVLQPVVDDAANGPRSLHGYAAFFKRNAAKSFIINIFRHIMAGLPRPDLSVTRPGDAHSPMLVCEDRLSLVGIDLFDHRITTRAIQMCYLTNGPTSFFVRSSRFLVLCNKFWDLEPIPPEGTGTCATVIGNKFVGNSENENIGAMVSGQQKHLVNYRRYHLLYALVDFYLDVVSLHSSGNPKAAVDWNKCVELDAFWAIANPSSYQLYAASKLSSMTRPSQCSCNPRGG